MDRVRGFNLGSVKEPETHLFFFRFIKTRTLTEEANLRKVTLAHVLETICVMFHLNWPSRLGCGAVAHTHTHRH